MTKSFWQKGIGLIEVMIAGGLLAGIGVAAMTLMRSQLKSQSFLEKKAQVEQLRLGLLTHVLSNPDNCKCLFSGTTEFPDTGIAKINTAATVIGRYAFTVPGDCGTATIPHPLLTTQGTAGLRLRSVEMANVLPVSGSYQGELIIDFESMKEVSGSKDARLRFLVEILTAPGTPGMVAFQGCTLHPSAGGMTASSRTAFTTVCRNFMTCDNQATTLCQAFIGAPDFCAKRVYSSQVDFGKQNGTTKGYICSSGLCSNGLTLE